MSISISVIIPVYNAAAFLTQAVESALAQPETEEVILVEDHSSDNSLEVCRALVRQHPQVRLYQHPGGVNRGAGPSRNLGMQRSTAAYIAFLDADDFYLPGRFSATAGILAANPGCDGVYEAVGIHFEDEQGRQRWLGSTMGTVRMTTLDRIVPAQDLFRVLMKGGSGHIHLDGLVIKHSLLEKTGYMNEAIADTLHEDTDFILRAAAVGSLLPGRLDQPIAIRRAHAANRVSAQRSSASIYRDHMRQRVATWRWCSAKGLKEHEHLAFKRMLVECVYHKPVPAWIKGEDARRFTRLLTWIFDQPQVVLQPYYWQELSGCGLQLLRGRRVEK